MAEAGFCVRATSSPLPQSPSAPLSEMASVVVVSFSGEAGAEQDPPDFSPLASLYL